MNWTRLWSSAATRVWRHNKLNILDLTLQRIIIIYYQDIISQSIYPHLSKEPSFLIKFEDRAAPSGDGY